MKFRAVLFDAAETLFTTRGSVGEIYGSVAREYGSNAAPEAIQAAFVRHFKGAGPVSVEDQKRWWRDVVYMVFNDVGMVENFDEFFERVYDLFRHAQGWRLFPETLDTLKQLKALGVKLGIISNFDTRIYSVLDSLGIRHFFDAVSTSSETGYSKPAREIFESAARALGEAPSAILVVGDNPHDDIEPALAAGMSAILIDRNGRFALKSRRSITSLAEIVSEVTP